MMKTINNYINEALIKKDTKITISANDIIFGYFSLVNKKTVKDKEGYLAKLKSLIDKWVNAYNIKSVDGPYIYSNDNNKNDYEEFYNFIRNNTNINPNEYKIMKWDDVENKLGGFNKDWNDKNKVMDYDAFSPYCKSNKPLLLGTSKRISYSTTAVSNCIIIFFIENNENTK